MMMVCTNGQTKESINCINEHQVHQNLLFVICLLEDKLQLECQNTAQHNTTDLSGRTCTMVNARNISNERNSFSRDCSHNVGQSNIRCVVFEWNVFVYRAAMIRNFGGE